MKFISAALYKEQLKRFWVVGALPMVVYLVFIVSMFAGGSQNQMYLFLSVITMRNPVLPIMSAVMALAAALGMFSYQFRGNAATAIYAFPMNKKQLFCTNISAGLTLFAVPLFIFCLFLMINPAQWQGSFIDETTGYSMINITLPIEMYPNIPESGDYINTFPVVAGFFLRYLLMFAFCYSLVTLAASLTGSTLSAFIVSMIIGLSPFIVWGLFELITNWFLLGSSALIEGQEWFLFVNPLFMYLLYNYHSGGSGAMPNVLFPWYLLYIAETVVFFALAFVCARARRQERAGDSFAFGAVKVIFLFGVSSAGMLAMGWLLSILFYNTASLYIGFVLGFILGYIVAQMLAERSFRILHKMKAFAGYAAVMAVLYAGLSVGSALDITGYASFSPAPSEIKGVLIGYDAYLLRGIQQYDQNLDPYFIHDAEVIADVCNLQQELVDNRRELLEYRRQNILQSYWLKNTGVSIVYEMADGKIVTRNYDLPQPYAENADFVALMTGKDAELAKYYSLKSPEKLDGIELTYTPDIIGGEPYSTLQYTITDPARVASLAKALQLDIVASSIDVPKSAEAIAAANTLSTTGDTKIISDEGNFIDGRTFINMEYYNNVYVNSFYNLHSYENTKLWLIENGYWEDDVNEAD